MPRQLEVPRLISEARADRLRVGISMDGTPRLLEGARAPTISEGAAAGGGAARVPSAHLLGEQDEQAQQTTISIVHVAQIGTQLFNYLDAKARAKGAISMDFRTFGNIRNRFESTDKWVIGTKETTGGAKGLNPLTASGAASQITSPNVVLGNQSGTKTLRVGGVLEVIEGTSSDDGPTIKKDGFTKRDHNPEFLVISAILYNASGASPRAFVDAPSDVTVWPNNGDADKAAVSSIAAVVAHRDPSVKWTATGSVQSYQPGFGEASALYTLTVTLTEAMPIAEVIHSADADWANPSYS